MNTSNRRLFLQDFIKGSLLFTFAPQIITSGLKLKRPAKETHCYLLDCWTATYVYTNLSFTEFNKRLNRESANQYIKSRSILDGGSEYKQDNLFI